MEILLVLLAVVIGWVLWNHNQSQKAKALAAVAESVKEEQAPYKVETPVQVAPTVEEIAAVAQVNSVVGAGAIAAVAVAEAASAEVKPAKAKTKKPAAIKAKKPAATKKPAPKKAPAKKTAPKKTA